MGGRRRGPAVVGAVAMLLAVGLAGPALAAEWGLITPGQTTQAAVSARYGAPTRQERQKTDGYDTSRWVYEGAQAPTGVRRMVVEFGLVTAGGFRADVVRDLRLEPKPNIFNRGTILNGWGRPQRVGRDNDADVFYYDEGLLVYFDPGGWDARLMVFGPAQKPPPGR